MAEKVDVRLFRNLVYEIVKMIPEGRVTSYGAIAKAIGYPNHSRMVGTAMNNCDVTVPAHRVVGHGGRLTGEANFHAPGEMQRLLEKEGIIVDKKRIRNFKDVFWNPVEEIE